MKKKLFLIPILTSLLSLTAFSIQHNLSNNSVMPRYSASTGSNLDPSKSFKDDFESYTNYNAMANNYNNSYLAGVDYDNKAASNNTSRFRIDDRFTTHSLLMDSYLNGGTSNQTYLTIKKVRALDYKVSFRLYSSDYNFSKSSQFGLMLRKNPNYTDTCYDDAYAISFYLQYSDKTTVTPTARINAGGSGRWEGVIDQRSIAIKTESWNDIIYNVKSTGNNTDIHLSVNGVEGGYIHLTTNPEFVLKGLISFISSYNFSYIDDLCITNNDELPSEKDNFHDEFDNYNSYDSADFKKKWTNNYLANKGTPAEKAHNDTSRLQIAKDPLNQSNQVLKFIADGSSDTYVTANEYFVQNYTMEFALMLDQSTQANNWFGFMLNKDYHKDGLPWGTNNSTNFIYLYYNGNNLTLSGSAYVNATLQQNFTIEDATSFTINKGQWVTFKITSQFENNKQLISVYGDSQLIGKVRSDYNISAGFVSFLNCNTICYIDDIYIKYAPSTSNSISENFSYDEYGDMGVRWNNYYLEDPTSTSSGALANNNDVFQIVQDPQDSNNSVVKMDSITKPTVGSDSYLTIKKLFTREFDLKFRYNTIVTPSNSSWIGVVIHKDFRNDKSYYQQNGIVLILQNNTNAWSGTKFNACYFQAESTGIVTHNIDVIDSTPKPLSANTWHDVNITVRVSYNSELDTIDTNVMLTVDEMAMGQFSLHNTVLSMHGSISLTNDNYTGYIDDVVVDSCDTYTLDELSNIATVDTLSDINYDGTGDLIIPFDNKNVDVTKITILMPEHHLSNDEYSYDNGYIRISIKAFIGYEIGNYNISIRTGDGIHIGGITTAKIALNSNLPHFIGKYLKMYDIPISDNRDTDLCRGSEGYYAKAKEYYMNLSAEDKSNFETSFYQDAKQRYIAWGIANNDATPLSAKSTPLALTPTSTNIETPNTIAIVLIIIASSSALLFIYASLRKRRKY